MKKEKLKVEQEIGFPLYAAAKEALRACQPELSEFGGSHIHNILQCLLFGNIKKRI